jgi:ABC-type transport system involved in cytochrome c biogenesis permease component
MSGLALVGSQIRYEQKSYWRNPLAAGFTFLFPLVLFFILVGVTKGATDSKDLGKGVHLAQYLTPSVLSYAVMSACFMSVAMTLVRQRESGVLKRLRGTPVPSWAVIGGVIGNAVIVATALSLVAIIFAVTAYGVSFPAKDVLPTVVTIALAGVAFCALGVAVSSIIPNVGVHLRHVFPDQRDDGAHRRLAAVAAVHRCAVLPRRVLAAEPRKRLGMAPARQPAALGRWLNGLRRSPLPMDTEAWLTGSPSPPARWRPLTSSSRCPRTIRPRTACCGSR